MGQARGQVRQGRESAAIEEGSGRDFQQYIGNQIKSTRLRRRLSQSELAELAGIDQAQISLFENGKVMPKMGTFYKLIRALEINPGDFFSEFDRSESRNSGWLDPTIDIVARRISRRIYKATRNDDVTLQLWKEFEESRGRKTTLLARLLVKVFFEPKFRKNVQHVNELGEYQKFIVGEMVGFMLSGKGDTSYFTSRELGDET